MTKGKKVNVGSTTYLKIVMIENVALKQGSLHVTCYADSIRFCWLEMKMMQKDNDEGEYRQSQIEINLRICKIIFSTSTKITLIFV